MKLFGTDGIRGRWGEPPLTASIALGLGQAVRAQFGPGPVLIGRDTRASGLEIRDELAGGLGGEVIDLGVVPTPAVSALVESSDAAAGIVITASHNPWHDNGLKVVGPEGGKLSLAAETELEERVFAGTFLFSETLGLGEMDGASRYLELLAAKVPAGLSLEGVTIALDCAHGAGVHTAPRALEALGAKVHAIGVEPNGRNINEGLGAVHPQVLAEHVVAAGSDVGICLDGDADRCILVDRHGKVVDGDALLLLLAGEPGVVGTVMCNAALERELGRRGLGFVRTAVGDRNVSVVLERNGWPVGGEPSGHVLLGSGFPTGDGVLTALHVLAGGIELADRLSDWRPDPSALVNVAVPAKPDIDSLSGLRAAKTRILRQGASRVLLRYSGTEPKLRVLVEAPDADDAQRFARSLADVALEDISR